MKKIIISIFLFMFLAANCVAQLKINYGITVGLSRNFKNFTELTYSPQYFNNNTIVAKRGFTSPVVGIHANLYYKLLYASASIEYNQLKAAYYSFNERGYNTTDAQNNIQFNKYFDESLTSYQYDKLNIPLELGFKILKRYALSPYIFGGVNINYLVAGKINTIEKFQDPQTKNITTRETPIHVFDNKDNYTFMGSRRRNQRLLGIGVQYKKHLSIKASVRSQLYLMVDQKSDPDITWDCFGYFKDYNSREYLLTVQYHF